MWNFTLLFLQLGRKIAYRSIISNRISIDMLEQFSSLSVITGNSK